MTAVELLRSPMAEHGMSESDTAQPVWHSLAKRRGPAGKKAVA